MQDFEHSKQQSFSPGQKVVVIGNGERSKNRATSNGYHRLKVAETYFIIKEEFFHLNNSKYKNEGRLYEVSKSKNDNSYSQNVFAFDLEPVFVPKKVMANFHCDLPNI